MSEYIKKIDVKHRIHDFKIPCKGELLIAIDNLPSADVVERKRGHWVNGKCSECCGHAPFWSMATTYYESDFCPHCGSDMRERKDNEIDRP